MSERDSLVSLARKILESAEELEQGNTGTMSDEDLLKARGNLISATFTLRTQVFNGPELLESHQIGYQTLSCLAWLVHFNIFTHIPMNTSDSIKTISYIDLSTRAAVPLSRLQSVARMAMTSGLFQEKEQGASIAHTALSAAFATDESLRDWVGFMTKYSSPMASRMTEATARWGDTTAKHQTAFNAAFETNLPWFEYVKVTPELPSIFAGYMRAMSRSHGLRMEHLVEGFDWERLGDDVVVVDVGGSTAQASIALANRFPRLKFVVQDLPEVVAKGPSIVAEAETAIQRSSNENESYEKLSSRITFLAHDFFQPQPKPAGLVPVFYLLRKILHDWPFARAKDILQQLAVAIRDGGDPNSRIVIQDTILPPSGTLGRLEEASLRVRDLTMAQCFNSKERELSEWKELLGSTEPKLAIKAWKNNPGSSMAIIEAGL
jgi:6-hydroxytryprostatin B O-methyltransferase